MRRRDALALALLVGGALALPPYLRRRAEPFGFEPLPQMPGFRRVAQGPLTGGGDVFAGLRTPEEAAADAALPADLCPLIHPDTGGASLPAAVFSDYFCPFCATLEQRLLRLREEGVPIALRFHPLPLLGERSQRLARVALAAARQTGFEPVHLDLMGRGLRPGPAALRDFAERHGLAADRLAADAASEAVTRDLAQALALGRALGLPGTPGLMVGRTLVVGAIEKRRLIDLIALERDTGFTGCA
jgi:protein-disulfide isomerase